MNTGSSSPDAPPPGSPRPLSPPAILGLALASVAAFHLGFLFAPLWWLVLVWLGGLFALRRVPCGRWAFYTGLAIGLGIYGPQLHFFWTIFGPAAFLLWLILAFWLALFLLLLHGVDRYWGTGWALALAPVLWLGLEFFRSELYYLRFAWLTAGSFPDPATWPGAFSTLGVYGLGGVLMLLAGLLAWAAESPRSAFRLLRTRPFGIAAALLILAWVGSLLVSPAKPKVRRLPVVGIQLEFPKPTEVLQALEAVHAAEPPEPDRQPALYQLSEYTFDGPVPDEIRAWCRDRRRWLVAGGRLPREGGGFYNTAFVVNPQGEIAFQQAKSVPIQFFDDGAPASDQRIWESPWGRLGLCICYDLSYARVVDRLIRQGALALIVPAMDTVAWGAYQHGLNARMTPIRAAEYRVPVFRVASSGLSQLVDRRGTVTAQVPFPGQGAVLRGELNWAVRDGNRLPFDRTAGPLAVVATPAIALSLLWQRIRRTPPPPPTDH